MEYVQEAVTTLHDFGTADPEAPTDRTSVVVPMTERDQCGLAAERVLRTLEGLDVERLVIPLRADRPEVADVVSWVRGFDLPAEVIWCSAPSVEALLAEAGLGGTTGKGRDVWLGLGVAASSEFVVVHDADATTYAETHVPRLLYPVANGYRFCKGYYARVENGRLYGRLCRLFYQPLVDALDDAHDHPILDYLGAFRYALAGEFATTGRLARRMRVQRGWGLEVGTLGEAFAAAGFDGSVQADLGVHEHDHRAVGGPAGLGDMCREVGAALFRAVEDAGVTLDYETLPDRYRERAHRLIEAYAADAGFNDLDYDRGSERSQVETYAGGIAPPGEDRRLPAWREAPIDPAELRERSAAAVADASD
ncbi:MAG: glycosyl transferase family 2 [Salinirussus sp.]